MLLSIYGPGEYFGEMAMLDGQPRSASMVTKTPCRLLIIRKEDFKSALFGNLEMAFRLLNRILAKLREATDRTRDGILRAFTEQIASRNFWAGDTLIRAELSIC